jgi:hypothetical protein
MSDETIYIRLVEAPSGREPVEEAPEPVNPRKAQAIKNILKRTYPANFEVTTAKETEDGRVIVTGSTQINANSAPREFSQVITKEEYSSELSKLTPRNEQQGVIV